MLATMEFDGLKGRTGSVKFDRLNLIVGPNGSGKSALLLGVGYAATGRTPTSDKPGAILAYTEDGKVRVDCALDSGFTWSRGCVQNEYTKATTNSLVIHDSPRLKLRDAETELSNHVGNFAPMFNVGNFLAMRPEQRREFVLDLLSGPESQAAIKITAKLEGAKVALSDANGDLKGLTASVRDMTSRKNATPQSNGDSRDELTKRLSENVQELADINTRIGKAAGLKTAKRKLKGQLETAVEDRKRLDSDLAAMRAKAPEVEGWKTDLAAAEKTAAEPVPAEVELSEISGFGDEHKVLCGQRDELANGVQQAAKEMRTAEVAEAAESTKLLVCADWKIVSDILQAGVFAGESIEPVRKVLAIAEAKLKDFGYDQLAAKVEGLTTRIASAKKQGENFETERIKVRDALAELDKRIEAFAIKNNEANKARTVKIQQISIAQAKAAMLGSDISLFATRLDETIKREKSLQANGLDLEKQLNELDIDGGESDQALADQKLNLETHIKELNEQIELRKEADDAVANLADVTAKMHKAEAVAEKAKQLVETTRKERDAALAELMSPILTGIEDFCGEPCYCNLVNERGTPIFEIGVRRDGIEIPMDALSGGERVMYCVGLIVAMTQYADQPEKFLLIEGAELDATNLAALAERMSTKAPDFQVFLATLAAPLGLPGWTVHDQEAVAV